MATFMESIKNLLFTILTVGYKRTSTDTSRVNRSDGSVSCIIFVASSLGFLFPVMEILGSPDTKSFELYFMLQTSFGFLCLLSSLAWMYLFYRSKTQPEVYLETSTSVADPAAKIMYIFLIMFTLGITADEGLNVILDISCDLRFFDYHYLCSSINRILEIFFCIVQTLILILLTRKEFQNKLNVNYVLAIALLTNGILWMFTNLRVGSNRKEYKKNETSEIVFCYYGSKIYRNILLPTWNVALQTHINYFILCVGLTASTLPSGLYQPENNADSETINQNGLEEHKTRIPDIVVIFASLVSFLPTIVVIVMAKYTRPPEISASMYLREWFLSTVLCPVVFLIVAAYKGLHHLKTYSTIEHTGRQKVSVKWIFKNDIISIMCVIGDISKCTLSFISELEQPFLHLLIILRLCYIFQIFVQTVFLLITERINLKYYRKMKHIALFLCVGNLVLWVYLEYPIKSPKAYSELPPEFEQIISSLSSMNRFLSFARFYRIYSLLNC